MPKILFRADAEDSIGTGDLMSLIYLSRLFQKNLWQCFFAVREYGPALEILKNHKLDNVYLISKHASISEEINFLRKICTDNGVDCLFMEITKHSLREYQDLGKPAPIKACVNFDGEITSDYDVVVNWCIDSFDHVYGAHKNSNTQFILGFENVILPDYFVWKAISKRVYGNKIEKILITMGGIDELDLTGKIVNTLIHKYSDYEIRVIVGPGYDYAKDLVKLMGSGLKNFRLKQNVDNLFEDYLWADLAFSAGGLTSSELVAAKIPSILIAIRKHQIKRCEYFFKNKWSCYAGYHTDLGEREILKSLNYMIKYIDLFRNFLKKADFRGGNEKIFKNIDSCRQSKKLVS